MNKKLILIGIIAFIIVFIIIVNMGSRNLDVPHDDDYIKGDSDLDMDYIRIKLTFNNEEVYVNLNNSKSSQDFVSMLPITLDFEDYNSTEKIATLPKELTVEDAPSGYTPKIGDFSYYAPWGNLSLFYKDFSYSNGLIKLGEFESGIEKLESLTGDFKMTIELVK